MTRAKPAKPNPWYDKWVEERRLREKAEAECFHKQMVLQTAADEIERLSAVSSERSARLEQLQTEVDLLREQLHERMG